MSRPSHLGCCNAIAMGACKERIGRNQFAAGAQVDRNNITYLQTTDFSYILPNYALIRVPAWQDGSTVDGDGNPIDTQVAFKGHAPNWSLYFADTLTLWKTVNVMVSGRYNYESGLSQRSLNSSYKFQSSTEKLCSGEVIALSALMAHVRWAHALHS